MYIASLQYMIMDDLEIQLIIVTIVIFALISWCQCCSIQCACGKLIEGQAGQWMKINNWFKLVRWYVLSFFRCVYIGLILRQAPTFSDFDHNCQYISNCYKGKPLHELPHMHAQISARFCKITRNLTSWAIYQSIWLSSGGHFFIDKESARYLWPNGKNSTWDARPRGWRLGDGLGPGSLLLDLSIVDRRITSQTFTWPLLTIVDNCERSGGNPAAKTSSTAFQPQYERITSSLEIT